MDFKYPRSDKYTLKDINLTIHPGEKISVVGQNGAGKTTFIKLLCRLYVPDKGEILLNGVNINEYDYNEYMRLLSELDKNNDRVDSIVNDIIKEPFGDKSIGKLDVWSYDPEQWDASRIKLGDLIDEAKKKTK